VETGYVDGSRRDLIAHWTQQHVALKARVHALAGRRALTPGEQRELAMLKKRKLLAKDLLYDLGRT